LSRSPHGLTLRGMAKLRTFWHLQVPTLKDPFRPQGGTKVRKFSPRQAPLPILHPTFWQDGKGTKFLTFTSAALSHPSLTHLSKTMPNLTTKLCPAIIYPASCLFSSSGSAKLRTFCLCQAPSHPLPQDTTELRTFGHSQVSPLTTHPLSKTPYASQGRERKGTEFSALPSPLIR